MTPLYIALPFAVISLCCAFIYPRFAIPAPKKKLVLKSTASLLFIIGGIIMTVYFPGKYTYLILSALICGTVGDVFLAINIMFPKKTEVVLTILGGVFFLAGHVLYLALFIGLYDFNLWLLFILAAFAAVPFLLPKAIENAFGTKKIIPLASVYAATVGLLIVATMNTLIQNPCAQTAVLFVGGVFFGSSDFMLLLQQGLKKDNQKLAAGHSLAVLYYVAQWLFILSIFLGGR